ncbi:hypothetical protein [Halobacteriovorax sp. JY17]|uniref:hypothetical protein n=1 Tax=Halobacteriovorax sp. JY17 TaxID=2014617 RepID=UPI000C3A7627|nr:hypothetical protein [Halobacteriovorax sp. JY17]PIK13838.1 MAG: hypothetical protein CES88_12690 [Halobacteriovorax sp. JY17]
MKLTRVLSVVLFLFISTSSVTLAATSIGQVRNSLWVFGVDNSVSTEVEMVGQGISQFSDQFDEQESGDDIASQQLQEVPEELDMAISKFES